MPVTEEEERVGEGEGEGEGRGEGNGPTPIVKGSMGSWLAVRLAVRPGSLVSLRERSSHDWDRLFSREMPRCTSRSKRENLQTRSNTGHCIKS